MNVLFICTSNKDRSPALEKYFKDTYPKHEYKSAGVNRYFCEKKDTIYLSQEMYDEADLVVLAEDIHGIIIQRDFDTSNIGDKWTLRLNLGEYERGNINEDYLKRADDVISKFLKVRE